MPPRGSNTARMQLGGFKSAPNLMEGLSPLPATPNVTRLTRRKAQNAFLIS